MHLAISNDIEQYYEIRHLFMIIKLHLHAQYIKHNLAYEECEAKYTTNSMEGYKNLNLID